MHPRRATRMKEPVGHRHEPALERCAEQIPLGEQHSPRPQLPRVLHPPPLVYQPPRYSYLPPSLSPSSSLGRKVRITHARNLAQHPWYVPGAYLNSEAAQPAISGPAALVASNGSRSIPHVWLSRCRAGPALTAATDSSRARASETRTRTLARARANARASALSTLSPSLSTDSSMLVLSAHLPCSMLCLVMYLR